MRLSTRLALIGLAVIAGTLAVVAFATYQIVDVSGRRAVDSLLRDELELLRADLPPLLPEDDVTAADMRRVALQYLATHPGSARHLTVITVGADTYSTRTGPEDLLELVEDGELPEVEPGRIRTVDTEEGPVRMLVTGIVAGGDTVGRATIAGSLEDVEEDARDALAGVAVASAIGLVLGGVALTVATRRAIRPATELARAVSSTGGADLSARVPVSRRMDEIGVLSHEVNRMLDRISEDAEHRRRMVSAVSHELRTPLAVVRGHLELFEQRAASAGSSTKSDAEEVQRLASVTRGEIERMTRIADDLEAIAQGLDAGAVEIGPVFVPDVMDELGERVRGLGTDGVRMGEAPAVVIDADQHRLAQALLNLVSNAVTHTPPDTRVEVNAAVEGGHLAFRVADDGPGIDPSIRDRIFEPFVTTRADGSTRGSGLGLAVVKALVEAQGGTVDVDSGPGGTTATVRLPLSSTDDE